MRLPAVIARELKGYICFIYLDDIIIYSLLENSISMTSMLLHRSSEKPPTVNIILRILAADSNMAHIKIAHLNLCSAASDIAKSPAS